jgi:hypothetical protein
MYIFTPIYKLHINGARKGKRNTPNGHWKMNSSPIPIIENNDGQTIGTRSSLVFFDKDKRKTRWLMYEFRLVDPPTQTIENEGMVCKMFCLVFFLKKKNRVLFSMLTITCFSFGNNTVGPLCASSGL